MLAKIVKKAASIALTAIMLINVMGIVFNAETSANPFTITGHTGYTPPPSRTGQYHCWKMDNTWASSLPNSELHLSSAKLTKRSTGIVSWPDVVSPVGRYTWYVTGWVEDYERMPDVATIAEIEAYGNSTIKFNSPYYKFTISYTFTYSGTAGKIKYTINYTGLDGVTGVAGEGEYNGYYRDGSFWEKIDEIDGPNGAQSPLPAFTGSASLSNWSYDSTVAQILANQSQYSTAITTANNNISSLIKQYKDNPSTPCSIDLAAVLNGVTLVSQKPKITVSYSCNNCNLAQNNIDCGSPSSTPGLSFERGSGANPSYSAEANNGTYTINAPSAPSGHEWVGGTNKSVTISNNQSNGVTFVLKHTTTTTATINVTINHCTSCTVKGGAPSGANFTQTSSYANSTSYTATVASGYYTVSPSNPSNPPQYHA